MVKRRSQVSMLLINTYFNSKNIEFIAQHRLNLAPSLHKVQNLGEWMVAYRQCYL